MTKKNWKKYMIELDYCTNVKNIKQKMKYIKE